MMMKQSLVLYYSSSTAKIIINDLHIDGTLESIYSTIISKIQKSLRNGSVR